jgi:hypothetical protein
MNVPLTRILAAGGLLLLGACTSQPVADPPIPSINSSPTTQTSQQPSEQPSLLPEPPPAEPAPPAPPEPVAAESAECKSPDLKVEVGQGEGTAGTVFRPLVFTNVSSKPCTIQGFPGVSYVTGDNGRQVGPAAVREGTKGAAITLAPGAKAQAPVGFTQVANYDPAVCRPTAIRGLRIYPPHETASVFVPMEGTGCAGNPPGGQQLRVKTIEKA